MSAANGVTTLPATTTPTISLRDAWVLRNAATETLLRTEQQMERLIVAASADELVALLDLFAPGHSPGVEWTRSLEPLIERLWAWCKPEAIAALESRFRERGPAWLNVANAFTPERGALLAERRRQPAWARWPAFTLA